jgi:hypothetical protein
VALAYAALAMAQVPDSATRARAARWFHALTDSVSAVESGSAAFASDLASASPDLVVARSERLRAHCNGAARVVDSLAATIISVEARRELTRLRAALEQCDADFRSAPPLTAARADSLKGWGPHRLARLGAALRRFRVISRPILEGQVR